MGSHDSTFQQWMRQLINQQTNQLIITVLSPLIKPAISEVNKSVEIGLHESKAC